MQTCSPKTSAVPSPRRWRPAERDRKPVPPLRETWPDIDVVDSYTIQLLNIRERLQAGATVRGHKVGLSSKAMQEMMDVDEPDYGHLLSDMECFSDTPVSVGRYCMPRVEVEVGVRPRPGASRRGLHRGRRPRLHRPRHRGRSS